MSLAITGKTAIVTGAANGIGLAIARHFLDRGAQVVCADMDEAVRWCAQQALPGDAVLLSPACASFDMYRNYAHRAQAFIDAVKELPC